MRDLWYFNQEYANTLYILVGIILQRHPVHQSAIDISFHSIECLKSCEFCVPLSVCMFSEVHIQY